MPERILKINQLIKKELSKILLKYVDFPNNVLATVTRVETAPNLSQSRVYVSTLADNKTSGVDKILNKQIYFIQQKLNQRLNMRPVPRIKFLQEKETGQAGKIEEILEKLKKEKQ